MSMDSDAPSDLSCQLESRHWVITYGDGKEEVVDGPGVVGKFICNSLHTVKFLIFGTLENFAALILKLVKKRLYH